MGQIPRLLLFCLCPPLPFIGQQRPRCPHNPKPLRRAVDSAAGFASSHSRTHTRGAALSTISQPCCAPSSISGSCAATIAVVRYWEESLARPPGNKTHSASSEADQTTVVSPILSSSKQSRCMDVAWVSGLKLQWLFGITMFLRPVPMLWPAVAPGHPGVELGFRIYQYVTLNKWG